MENRNGVPLNQRAMHRMQRHQYYVAVLLRLQSQGHFVGDFQQSPVMPYYNIPPQSYATASYMASRNVQNLTSGNFVNHHTNHHRYDAVPLFLLPDHVRQFANYRSANSNQSDCGENNTPNVDGSSISRNYSENAHSSLNDFLGCNSALNSSFSCDCSEAVYKPPNSSFSCDNRQNTERVTDDVKSLPKKKCNRNVQEQRETVTNEDSNAESDGEISTVASSDCDFRTLEYRQANSQSDNMSYEDHFIVNNLGKLILPNVWCGEHPLLKGIELWENLAAMIANLIVTRALSLATLKEYFSLALVVRHRRGSAILTDIFKYIKQERSFSYLQILWQQSGLRLEEFMSTDEIGVFIRCNNFEFVYDDEFQSLCPGTCDTINNMFSANFSINKIFEWIQKRVGGNASKQPYLNILATTVFKSCIENNRCSAQKLRNKCELLLMVTRRNIHLDVQCLTALYNLACKLKNPQGLLLSFFDQLFDNCIYPFEVFLIWKYNMEENQKDFNLNELDVFFHRLLC